MRGFNGTERAGTDPAARVAVRVVLAGQVEDAPAAWMDHDAVEHGADDLVVEPIELGGQVMLRSGMAASLPRDATALLLLCDDPRPSDPRNRRMNKAQCLCPRVAAEKLAQAYLAQYWVSPVQPKEPGRRRAVRTAGGSFRRPCVTLPTWAFMRTSGLFVVPLPQSLRLLQWFHMAI
jgi:hypothetical protein